MYTNTKKKKYNKHYKKIQINKKYYAKIVAGTNSSIKFKLLQRIGIMNYSKKLVLVKNNRKKTAEKAKKQKSTKKIKYKIQQTLKNFLYENQFVLQENWQAL